MADEQTPHSDVIDDAIRNAEQQLEQKLQALRMSALGDTAPAEADTPPPAEAAWQGTDPGTAGDFTPTPTEPTGGWEPAPHGEWRGEPEPAQWQPGEPGHGEPAYDVDAAQFEPADPAPQRTPDSAWDDAVIRPTEPVAADSWSTGSGFVPDAGEVSYAEASPEPTYEPAPLHEPAADPTPGGAWQPSSRAAGYEAPSVEEEQFWAQTRTALRMLQQTSEALPQAVTGTMTDQVERIVRDELVAPNASLRQLQQQLPTVADRIEQAVVDELAAPVETIRQMQEELPLQIERIERGVHAALQQDLGELEHTVAENVTRLASSVADHVTRNERSVNENVDRVERGVRGQFDHIEQTMRVELDRVSENVRAELESPTASMRQLHEELPVHFQRIERVVRDQDPSQSLQALQSNVAVLQQRQDQIAGALQQVVRDELSDIVEASRLTLDKLGVIATDAGRDRVQRAEDLELLVDSMSKGWQGLYGAVTQLFERVGDFDDRMQHVESKLEQINRLERTVDQHLESMQQHLQELQPAPVIVTVNHPDAQVAQETRGGYVKQD
jgi:hypothetical protein